VNKIILELNKEKKYFFVSRVIIVLLIIISMAQNVIRYGVQENYNPWGTVMYLFCSLLIFIPFLPTNLLWFKYSKIHFAKYYWLSTGLAILITILVFYIISNTGLYFLGFKYKLLSIQYAQQYFGREALYHILLLIGTSFYVNNKYQKDVETLISGMLGRKEITIRANLINWIESDDHYLKINTDEFTIIKRATLEKMAEQLQPEFIRIHRKFLVNKNAILNTERKQRDEYVVLTSGEKLKVGRTYSPIRL
jgi:hypothetical protein